MGELKVEAHAGRQAATRPAGREAGCSGIAEMGPGVGFHGANNRLESGKA